ncbi:MAG: SRPBCC family protein [Patulibacter minatonensis]
MSEFEFSRSIKIDAPPAAVYAHLVDFEEWRRWSPWEGLDDALLRTYSDPSAGVGARYAWSGNRKAGEGSMVITRAVAAAELMIDLEFLKPFKAKNELRFVLTPTGDGTTVDWIMSGTLDSLASKVFAKLMPTEKLVGKDFTKGLEQLKAISEAPAT